MSLYGCACLLHQFFTKNITQQVCGNTQMRLWGYYLYRPMQDTSPTSHSIPQRNLILAVVSIIIYIIIYVAIFPYVGLPGALLVIPAIWCGWLLGARGGLVAGVFLVALTILLTILFTGDIQRFRETWLGFAIAAPLGGIIGWLKEQHGLLRQQARDLETARAELARLNAELEKRVIERTAEIHSLNADLERRVEERTRQLSEANAQLEAFSSMVAHDLRNPLTMAQSYNDLLMMYYGNRMLDEEAQEYLRSMRQATDRMAQLIQDLFVFARSTQGELIRTPVDISQIVQEMADELRKRTPNRQIEFVIAPRLVVNGDDRFLRVLLDNLYSNAWKYSSKREQTRIELGTLEQEGQRVYFVRDNGAGFDMARAVELFQPFRRLHTTEEFTGVGLGLATCKRIVERHGGRIWVESKVGEGTTFFFTLGPS